MSWPVRIATLSKGGWPAGMTHDIDFVRQRYRYARRSYAAVTDIPGTTFSRATAAYGDDTADNLILFPSGVPRITNKGVLIEEGRTNVLLRSQEFDNAAWIKSAATITANAAIAPDGTQTADAVTQTGANGSDSRVQQNVTIANNSQTYTCSWYTPKLQSAPAAYPGFVVELTGGSIVSISLTLDPVSGNYAATSAAVSVQSAGNYWRVSITIANNSSGNTTLAFMFYPSFAASVTTTRNTVSGVSNVVAFGQAEAGSFPTSYIPTTSASVTRNADVLASANDPNPAAYTVVAEFTVPLTGPVYGRVWCWDDGTVNNRTMVYYDRGLGQLYAVVDTGGVNQAAIYLGVVTPGQTYKVAMAVAANDFAAICTGGTLGTDASGAVPSTNQFGYGCSPASGDQFGGVVRRVRRFSTRKTNSELQALVA